MKKNIKVIIIIVSILIICLLIGIIIGKNKDVYNDNSNETQTDIKTVGERNPIKFKNEYESRNGTIREKDGFVYNTVSIDENNPIVYINLEELVYLIESQQEAIVFISTSDCPYCRASIESLLKAAKDLNIDTIYYYDISNNQEDDEELKNKIIDKKIANKNDNGSLRWTIPQVLKFKNSKLISSATGMMYELQNNQTKYDELSENQKNNIYSIYYIVLSKNEGELD